MAQPTDFSVDPVRLGAAKERLQTTFMTFMDAIGTSPEEWDVALTGSDDLSNRLDQYFSEANKGMTKFTGEIMDMMKRLKTAADLYQQAEEGIGAANDSSARAFGGS